MARARPRVYGRPRGQHCRQGVTPWPFSSEQPLGAADPRATLTGEGQSRLCRGLHSEGQAVLGLHGEGQSRLC